MRHFEGVRKNGLQHIIIMLNETRIFTMDNWSIPICQITDLSRSYPHTPNVMGLLNICFYALFRSGIDLSGRTVIEDKPGYGISVWRLLEQPGTNIQMVKEGD